MSEERLLVSLYADDQVAMIEGLPALPFFPDKSPEEVEVDHSEVETEDWFARLKRAKTFRADFDASFRYFVSRSKGGVVKISTPSVNRSDLLSYGLTLSSVHVELASFARIHKWRLDSERYIAPSFANDHVPHGFACAFKRSGHDRLVSRRWLDYGPWRLIRDKEQDFSFVQFHDLNADAETALEQAKPGHERMGITDHGGFLQRGYVYETDFDGIYLPDEEILEIVVHGRKIPDVELLDACALRHYQDLGDDKPLKNVRYVFVGGEQQTREYLHELWLRELECWAIVDGQKVRLDEDYEAPEPEKPDWVAKIED